MYLLSYILPFIAILKQLQLFILKFNIIRDQVLNALATFADAIAIPDFQFPDFYDDNLHTPITKINSELEQFKNFIRFGHLNAVSVPKHREEIYRVIRETLLDIFAVCETNIKPGTPSHLYQMPGYK